MSARRRPAASQWDAPSWAAPTSLVLCVLGLAVSAYLTYEHYTGSKTLACSSNGVVNCHAVTTSSYAVVYGVPVALLGLLFFAVMTLLCLPQTWRRGGGLDGARLGATGIGVLMVLYLLFVELFRLDRICLWCTAVHVLTIALFAVVAGAEAVRRP
ncbi:MAG: vitamin K epoxide reductase family protein [Actinomycetota bacterium]|nr:vitamin K epoxide reductase family protein [Actinomycetota bacterium]